MPVRPLVPTNIRFRVDDKFQRTYTRTYRVITLVLDETAAWGIVGIGPGLVHPFDRGAVCTGIDVQSVKRVDGAARDGSPVDGWLWDVSVEYGPWNPLEHFPGGDPLKQPLQIRFDPLIEERPLFVDYQGVPIVNSAYDYFDPPLMGGLLKGTLSVTRNESNPDIFAYNQYADKVNASTWNNCPAKTVKSLPIALPEPAWAMTSDLSKNGAIYYPIRYGFEINPEGYQVSVPDRGVRRLGTTPAGSPGQLKIRDPFGNPVAEPVFLNGAGQPIEGPLNASNIVFLTFDEREPIDFGVFNMDDLKQPNGQPKSGP